MGFYKSTKSGEISAVQVVVAIIILLIVALALLSVSTGAITDLGSRVKSVISTIFGGYSSGPSNTGYSGAIDDVLEKATTGYDYYG